MNAVLSLSISYVHELHSLYTEYYALLIWYLMNIASVRKCKLLTGSRTMYVCIYKYIQVHTYTHMCESSAQRLTKFSFNYF